MDPAHTGPRPLDVRSASRIRSQIRPPSGPADGLSVVSEPVPRAPSKSAEPIGVLEVIGIRPAANGAAGSVDGRGAEEPLEAVATAGRDRLHSLRRAAGFGCGLQRQSFAEAPRLLQQRY